MKITADNPQKKQTKRHIIITSNDAHDVCDDEKLFSKREVKSHWKNAKKHKILVRSKAIIVRGVESRSPYSREMTINMPHSEVIILAFTNPRIYFIQDAPLLRFSSNDFFNKNSI
jgi:hypothetical protein